MLIVTVLIIYAGKKFRLHILKTPFYLRWRKLWKRWRLQGIYRK